MASEKQRISSMKPLIALWHEHFQKGTDFDLWGQPIEATETYQKLAGSIRPETVPDSTMFTDAQKKTLVKIAACLELRCKSLKSPGRLEGISLEDLKKIENNLKYILNGNKDFPIEVTLSPGSTRSSVESGSPQHSAIPSIRSVDDELEEGILNPEDYKMQGSLLPPPDPVPGKTIVTIGIDKIGLKDAVQLIDPFITISVKDSAGIDLMPVQDTPTSIHKEDQYVYFGVDVYLQRPLEHLPQGLAIFFEFKHFKPKKRKTSTKCWAFMERDEIKEGPVVIELYKKPTDLKRKNINLLTVKPLYLHLRLIFNR